MFNASLRRVFSNHPTATVKNIKDVLACLPDDMEVKCCGADEVWLHVDEKNNMCSFDYDALDDEYEED